MDRETTKVLPLKKLNNYEHKNLPDECSFIVTTKSLAIEIPCTLFLLLACRMLGEQKSSAQRNQTTTERHY
jgi:hypothetical protein